MNMPSFHDGGFSGIVIEPDENTVLLFLNTVGGDRYQLTLIDVNRLQVSEFRKGNIVFDLTFRSGDEISLSDLEYVGLIDSDSPKAEDILHATQKSGLQILEMSSSYGAQGLFLFRTYEVAQARPRKR